MRFSNRYLLTGLLALFAANQLSAQNNSPAFADINYVRKSSAWLNSHNAAGLKNYNGEAMSTMQLFYNKTDGNFRNYYESNHSQAYGLTADAIKRINPNVVIAGGLSYKNFAGKNMTGSVFINPYVVPFNIVELDEQNMGKKTSEIYDLSGSVSAKVTSKLTFGGKLNYEAGNYAKQKDLRHTNKLLDMSTSVGVTYDLTDALEIGANYNYARRIESLNFKTYGNTDRTFLSLIDYGAFYGKNELFGANGYTASGTTNPLKDVNQGAAVQLNVKLNEHVKWYNEFTYGSRKGFYGEEGTSSILFSRHNGQSIAYHGALSIKANNAEHNIALNANFSNVVNKENIYRRGTTDGGLTQIINYDMKQVGSGNYQNIGLAYNLFLDVNNNQPKWAVTLNADYAYANNNTNLYPFYREQTIKSYVVAAKVSRNIARAKDAFNVGLGLGYGAGTGTMANDGLFVRPSDSNTPPNSMNLFLSEEYEFFTKSRVNANVDFKYTKALESNIGAFVKASYAHTFAPDVAYLGKHLNAINLSVGFNF